MSIFSHTDTRRGPPRAAARTEIGLLDVRPEGRFATGHPLFAASFPLGRLEAEAADRLPRRSVPVVVYGDGADDAAAAARTAARARLHRRVAAGGRAGGLDGRRRRAVRRRQRAEQGVRGAGRGDGGNAVVAAGEVAALLAAGRSRSRAAEPARARGRPERRHVVVVDARRFDEYETMSIPTATSVPGAELALRVRALAPDPATTVVVNCAGRTRRIIGTQSLINAGLPNRVVALRNGTIGWTLAGLSSTTARRRRAPEVAAETARAGRGRGLGRGRTGRACAGSPPPSRRRWPTGSGPSTGSTSAPRRSTTTGHRPGSGPPPAASWSRRPTGSPRSGAP